MAEDIDDLDVDIRVASVIWAEDAEPEVNFTGCSRVEALGLLLVGLRDLLFEDFDEADDDE